MTTPYALLRYSPSAPTTVPGPVASLIPWVDADVFGPAEVFGAEVLTRAAPDSDPLVHLAAAFAIWAPIHGHACVDLGGITGMVRAEMAVTLAEAAASDATPATATGDDPIATVDAFSSSLPWPDTDGWITRLRASPLVRRVENPDPAPVLDDRPLVMHGRLLYTQRQWVDECSVAAALHHRSQMAPPEPLSDDAHGLLDRLLPPTDLGETNLQHVAAVAALSSRLTVIIGGPGTGKTHTVAQTLAVMLADARTRGASVRIGLAAPTGKAAARMQEAIAGAAAAGRGSGSLTDAQAAELGGLEASTIHRLLVRRGSSTRFFHDAVNPLPYDVVVIDEASMVALPLMARLLEAVRPDAQLVLVGDPDQLHSIEVGAVLADIVSAASDTGSPLHDRVVRLQRSRRQQSGSPIGPLADAVRDNRAGDVIDLLRRGAVDPIDGRPLLTLVETTDPLATDGGAGAREVVLPPLTAAAEAAQTGNAVEALRRLATIRVLCAHRSGPHGAAQWNRMIESWLLAALDRVPLSAGRFYPGRALLATRNDRRQRVANGDTGIVITDPAGVRAAFGTADGLRILAPAQLERVETAFASTIHKSQGSEYTTVVVVLPPATSPLAGRELLYTALTRSTDRLVVIGTEAAVVACVQTPSRRVTGLANALRAFPAEV